MMDDKLIRDIEALRDSAIQRGSRQGIQVYELALAQLAGAKSLNEVTVVRARLRDTLVRIDAHGHFTPDELAIVKRILDQGSL